MMIVFTDNIFFAGKYLTDEPEWNHCIFSDYPESIRLLCAKLFEKKEIFQTTQQAGDFWHYLFIVEYTPNSQFDELIDLSRQNISLPGGILCLAGSGKKFHGFKNRSWVSLPGNLHLSVYFSPGREIHHSSAGFMILTAVSVIQTLDTLPGLCSRSSIKWVNDILIEKVKVCGVLAHTQTQGKRVMGVILGIGLNILTTPVVEPTLFVPAAAALCDFQKAGTEYNERMIFNKLISFLAQNYNLLLEGGFTQLFNFYKKRSFIINKTVSLWDDSDENNRLLARGKVLSIGENLELFLSGTKHPVTKGRLVFEG